MRWLQEVFKSFSLATGNKKYTTIVAYSLIIMSNFVKNIFFLLFFFSFAWGVFYVSTSQDFLHFSERVFLGEIGNGDKEWDKINVLSWDFSIELESDDSEDDEIIWQRATPQSADLTAPLCTASYQPDYWTSGSVVVTLTCSEEVEFCAMDDYSDCPPLELYPAEDWIPCSRAQDITYNGYIIKACNLGATTVGSKEVSYGNYYQWGNNYPMGDYTVNSYTPTSSFVVNASAYWPWNPYFSWTRITADYWDRSNNPNLRWGSGDTDTTNGPGTWRDRQGPCPDGYHVPSALELIELVSGATIKILDGYLFLPYAGFRNPKADLEALAKEAYYWTSSPIKSDAYYLYFSGKTIKPGLMGVRWAGYPIRCFANQRLAWVETRFADLTPDDTFVFVGTYKSTYALPNNATSAAPTATSVNVVHGEIQGTVPTTLQRHLSWDSLNGYIFYPAWSTSIWLDSNWGSTSNLRVKTGNDKYFVLDSSGYLKNLSTARYLGIYKGRSRYQYSSPSNSNIVNQTFKFYKATLIDY